MKKMQARLVRLFLSLALALLLAGGAGAVDLAVELPSTIEARDGAFYLGEYAVFEGDDVLAASASMAVLTPSDGFLTREGVIEALGATAVAGRAVALRMPEVIRVVPESPVAAQLRAIANWAWRIDVRGVPADMLPGGPESFSLPPRVLAGARTVAVKIGGERKVNRQAKLKWYQPVVYAARDLRRGAALGTEELGTRIETVSMNSPCAWEPSQLSQATLKRALQAGRAISFGDVDQLQVVKSGSHVALVANVNGLAVSVSGLALERGGVGDLIRVRNLSSKKVVTGRIIDVGRVEIDQ